VFVVFVRRRPFIGFNLFFFFSSSSRRLSTKIYGIAASTWGEMMGQVVNNS